MEAKFKGGAKWYSGSVVAVNRDGSYDIRYDDGDKEQRVPPSNVRLVDDGKAVKPSDGRQLVEDETVSGKSAFKLGDKVEAKFKGGVKWFSGRISSVNRDGTYDVRYDDGDEEQNVPPLKVREIGAKSPSRLQRDSDAES